MKQKNLLKHLLWLSVAIGFTENTLAQRIPSPREERATRREEAPERWRQEDALDRRSPAEEDIGMRDLLDIIPFPPVEAPPSPPVEAPLPPVLE